MHLIQNLLTDLAEQGRCHPAPLKVFRQIRKPHTFSCFPKIINLEYEQETCHNLQLAQRSELFLILRVDSTEQLINLNNKLINVDYI